MHIVVYVEGCSQKVKKFETKRQMKVFVEKFLKKHPQDVQYKDDWIEFTVTDVKGELKYYDGEPT